MEVTTSVQAVVNASMVYLSNPSDVNQVQLQRQLDVLISLTGRVSSLSCFNPKEMLPAECLSYMVDIMDDPQTKSTLAQKVLLLFHNLANKPELSNVLHATFNLTSCLARFLKTQTMSAADPNVLLCVKLLQKITYNCKVSFQEVYVEDLIKLLIIQIQEKEDELTLPCVSLLANLCRHNLPVQMIIKNQEKVRSLYQKLSNLLSHENNRLVVSALSALVSLCFNETVGEKIFNTRNINQIFQLLFSVLMKSEGGSTLRYTVDVFTDLIKHSRIQKLLSVYSDLDRCLSQLLSQLQKRQGDDITKIFELLLSLCSVTGVRCTICRRLLETTFSAKTTVAGEDSAHNFADTFSAVIHWASQPVVTHSDMPLLALDFIKEMYEEILDQGLLNSVGPHTDQVLPVIRMTLSSADVPEGPVGRKHCNKLTKALQLAILFASDNTLRPLLSAIITTDLCGDLIEYQLCNNAVGLKGMRWKYSHDTDDWSEDGVGVILYTLDLMMLLSKDVTNMNHHFTQLVQGQRLVSYLSYGLLSGIRDYVHIVLKIISQGAPLPEFPIIVLGDNVAALVCQQQSQLQSHMALTSARGQPNVLSDKENIPQTHFKGYSHHIKGQTIPAADEQPSGRKMSTSIDELIAKMQNGLQLKDARASEIISVYEHKLQSLQTKESHLQDLLEAKTLAMSQADRLITQYRCRMAQNEAEAQKLRSLLQESEKRSEDYREQLNEMMLEQERLSNDLEQMAQDNARLEAIADEHKELTEAYAEQTQRLENNQRALITLKAEHHSLSEMHEMLRRHNETLKQQYDVASEQLIEMEDERKNLSKLLKEREKEISDLSKALRRSEKELKKVMKERDDLELAIDTMRENLSSTEQAKKELQRQVSALELVCHQHEKTLKEKDKIIKEQKENIDKHNKIAALIHDITSGKEGAK